MAAAAARFARSLTTSRLIRAGLALLVIGWTPLLLYVAYESASGQTGGNPIGLGLLMFFTTPIAAVLVLCGVVSSAVASRTSAR